MRGFVTGAKTFSLSNLQPNTWKFLCWLDYAITMVYVQIMHR